VTKALNNLLVGLLFICASVTLVNAVKFGLASGYSIGVVSALDYFDAHQQDANLTALPQAERLVEKMRMLSPTNPYYASQAASFLSWQLYLQGIDDLTEKSAPFNLETGALSVRPSWPDSHSQRILYQLRANATMQDLRGNLELAQRYGPFEAEVASTSLIIYLKYWDIIDVREKRKTIGYLLEHDKYGINKWELSDLLAKNPYKFRACNILTFNQIHLKACR